MILDHHQIADLVGAIQGTGSVGQEHRLRNCRLNWFVKRTYGDAQVMHETNASDDLLHVVALVAVPSATEADNASLSDLTKNELVFMSGNYISHKNRLVWMNT